MGWISAVFAHKVIDAATNGASSDEALRRHLVASVGLDPDGQPDPEQMIGDADFFGLLERIEEDSPRGRDVALRVGASMRCDDYGAFGLAFKSAIDLESSYLRVERYGRVVTSISNFRLLREGSTTLMEVIPGPDQRTGLLLINELALAAATALSREVGDADFAPLTVHISSAVPDDTSAFEAHFRCPVLFGTERNALEVSNDQLRYANRLGDTLISRFFDEHLDSALADLPQEETLGRRVRAEITRALSEGVPTTARMGARLGMSSRTLQRRLAEVGLSYRDLVDEARRELAQRLLRTTDYGLAEIAFLTGFSEQSAFQRAFKRWADQTPQAYRRQAAGTR